MTDYLLETGETSVGGNLLTSAATSALSAAREGDVARLAVQRREVADARDRLADEVLG